MLDKRYTIGREYTGHQSGKPRHVLRFCGEYISEHASKRGAERAADTYERKRQKFLGKLPVRDDVVTVTYHRPPTKAEIRFGHGATHYREFRLDDCCDMYNGAFYLKAWFKAHDDGLRYYR